MTRAAPLLALTLGFLFATPRQASAYEQQVSLDLGVGWGFAPMLEMAPNHGPLAAIATTIGFDDTWALGITASWAIHPAFVDSTDPTLQFGQFGAEALYYIDILQVVPFFGAGVDLLPSTDGTAWSLDFAVHLRLSIDYLLSRELTIGVDVRPYVLLTALSTDPVYITAQVRLSFLFDY